MSKIKTGFIETAMRYRQIVILIVSLLVVLGVYSLVVMPKNEFPTYKIRQGLVVGVYPGATSAEVEEQLTKPLEEFIFSFKEVNKSGTVSQSRDGMVFVTVELQNDIQNPDEFWAKFKHRLSEFKSSLPSGVLAVQAKDDFGDVSALLITLESEQKTYRELQRYLDDLEDRLRRIESVSNLTQYGVQNEQISIYVDQEKLSAYAINSTTMAMNLFTQGFTTLSGSIQNNSFKSPIHIEGMYNNERDIAESIIYYDPTGNAIRLKDVARVVREYPDPDTYVTNNAKKCVVLSIEMREGNNIVQLGEDVNAVLTAYEEELPDDVEIYRITDQSYVVSESVTTFLLELLIAVMAVILVIMLLMPLRVASVAASTIPITIFIALAIFYAFGIELNTVTLAALIVTLGMIVDNSIVIIDSYMDNLDKGMSRWDAAVKSANEFFMAILSATLAISITFFPFLFTTTGMLNDFLQAFPWAMSIILFGSLLVAVLLIPYMEYHFIHKGLQQVKMEKNKQRKNFLDIIQNSYNKILEVNFRFPKLTILVGLLSIVVGGIMFIDLPKKLLPFAERNQFVVEIYLPKGSSLDQTVIVADSLEKILRQDDRIISVTAFMGQGSPRFHAGYAPQFPGDNYAQFIVNTTSDKATDHILKEYGDKYNEYFPNARVRLKQLEYSDVASPVEIRLSGENLAELKAAAEQVRRLMLQDENLALVRTNFEEQTPGVTIKLNDNEMNRLGLNKTAVSVNTAMRFGTGIPLTTVWEGDYPVDVVLKTEGGDNADFNDILDSYIGAWGGAASVPMRQIAEVVPDWNEGQIVHRNGIRTISVTADVQQGVNVNSATKAVEKYVTQLDISSSIAVTTGGSNESDAEKLPMIIIGLAIAIMIIFLILLFHYKKINLALLLLGSTPLCVVGAAFGIWIMKLDVSITCILGIISLMGIFVRNGIIMIDYAEELRIEKGLNAHDAAMESGKRRMRPIFLTSAAASMGVIPMILGGSSLWAPMGSVIFFGTIISMFFIVCVIPVAYWYIFRATDKKLQQAN